MRTQPRPPSRQAPPFRKAPRCRAPAPPLARGLFNGIPPRARPFRAPCGPEEGAVGRYCTAAAAPGYRVSGWGGEGGGGSGRRAAGPGRVWRRGRLAVCAVPRVLRRPGGGGCRRTVAPWLASCPVRAAGTPGIGAVALAARSNPAGAGRGGRADPPAAAAAAAASGFASPGASGAAEPPGQRLACCRLGAAPPLGRSGVLICSSRRN